MEDWLRVEGSSLVSSKFQLLAAQFATYSWHYNREVRWVGMERLHDKVTWSFVFEHICRPKRSLFSPITFKFISRPSHSPLWNLPREQGSTTICGDGQFLNSTSVALLECGDEQETDRAAEALSQLAANDDNKTIIATCKKEKVVKALRGLDDHESSKVAINKVGAIISPTGKSCEGIE
jgi:hypothetical protein